VRPVDRGEADQPPVDPRPEKQALVARRQEPAEEADVAFVIRLGQVEALVPGDQGKGLLELRFPYRPDLHGEQL
jgi:hypothetical protein